MGVQHEAPGPKKITTKDMQGKDKTIEIHGTKGNDPRGITQVGGGAIPSETKIVSQRPKNV